MVGARNAAFNTKAYLALVIVSFCIAWCWGRISRVHQMDEKLLLGVLHEHQRLNRFFSSPVFKFTCTHPKGGIALFLVSA